METEQKSNGALVGLIVIIIILIVGGVYIWQNSLKERAVLENQAETNTETDNSTSIDSEATLESDVDGMDLESLDEGL